MDSQDNPPRKIVPITPVAQTPADAQDSTQEMVSLYVAHNKIYPRSVQGLFAYWRWVLVFITQIVFYGLPWLEWGQRQAVLFDLGARRFYIFGVVLYPQDFIYLTAILVISAFSLFLFTAVAGRLWCGYACPQTVYSEIFLWVERKIEGDRTARMKLDAANMSLEKLFKKWYKHFIWIGIALWTGFTFVGYFTPIRSLGMEFFTGNMTSWEVFWVFFYGFATYGNAGFMREQVCKYMCPYARFQSAMFDKDTLIVTYDAERGEPRGARSKKADPKTLGLGSCVDCSLCVQVCPWHRHPQWPAVRVHRLWCLCRRVRYGDGEGGLRQRAGEILDPKCHDGGLDARADLAARAAPARVALHRHLAGGGRGAVLQSGTAQAIQGGCGA